MKVFSFLKHLFIPHQGNDYKPHFFRELSIKIILALIIFLLGVSIGRFYFVNKTVLGASIVTPVLIDLTNQDRLAYNQKPLSRSNKLDEAATLKAKDMVDVGYFAHNSPEGISPWHWFSKVGYKFLYAGENLAINFTDTKAVEDAWLSSPTHRANLLNVNFQEIGLATAEGLYNGNSTIFIVQMFGTPAKFTSIKENLATSSIPIKKVDISTSTNNIKQQSEVKGDSSSTESMIEPITTVGGLTIVKNLSQEIEQPEISSRIITYSKWYERLLFNGSSYIGLFYKTLLSLIIMALLTMLFVEIRKQHWRHISYGVLTILILFLAIIINNYL
jgi:hypothetical protein